MHGLMHREFSRRNERALAQNMIYFFGVRNWLCGVRACENMQKRVSHGETVRVGSSACIAIILSLLCEALHMFVLSPIKSNQISFEYPYLQVVSQTASHVPIELPLNQPQFSRKTGKTLMDTKMVVTLGGAIQ